MSCFVEKEGHLEAKTEKAITNDCLSENTLIRMGDGSEKRIADVVRGDYVQTNKGVAKEVTDIIWGREMTLIDITANNGQKISLTDIHPVLTDSGVMRACNLKMGDRLIMEGGKEARLLNIIKRNCSETVYSLKLDDSENLIIANGFSVGDFNCQNRL